VVCGEEVGGGGIVGAAWMGHPEFRGGPHAVGINTAGRLFRDP